MRYRGAWSAISWLLTLKSWCRVGDIVVVDLDIVVLGRRYRGLFRSFR
jgi:hypothetical protein